MSDEPSVVLVVELIIAIWIASVPVLRAAFFVVIRFSVASVVVLAASIVWTSIIVVPLSMLWFVALALCQRFLLGILIVRVNALRSLVI